MNTQFVFSVSCTESARSLAQAELDLAHSRVRTLEQHWSEFLPESPVHQLNLAAPQVRVPFSHEAFELLEVALRLCEATHGAFDPLAKSSPLADGSSGSPRIELDRSQRSVWRLDSGARLSFGAIGKGAALDQVALQLLQAGLENFLLNAGGSSIILSGNPAPRRSWEVGWSWTQAIGNERTGIPLRFSCNRPARLGISGTEEQGSHILDAHTGAPPQNYELTSVLVDAPSAAEADALSTALFARGLKQAQPWLTQLKQIPGVAAITHGTPIWNDRFQKYWGAIPVALGLLLATLSFPESSLAQPGPTPSAAVSEEELVDLSVGLSDAPPKFNPYPVKRSPIWLLPAVFASALLLLHLKKAPIASVSRKEKK